MMIDKRLNFLAAALTITLLTEANAAAQTIFTGPRIEFNKPAFADPFSAAAQDRITDNVWISRGDNRGIFNPAVEGLPTGRPNLGPTGTEWAAGTTADLGTLTFSNWVTAITQDPPGSVGMDYVVHLIEDDIFLDLRFTSWGGNGSGGTFSYSRTTDVPEPAAALLVCLAAMCLAPRRAARG